MRIPLRTACDVALHSISLCAGVGALDLGLRIADPAVRTVCYVEWAQFPAAVIAARIKDKALDDAPVWDDVGTFDGRPWRGRVDLITAGFPCQPVSLAGQRRGMADERFIWGDIERIISEVGPRYVFLENVPGIVSADDGWFLDRVLSGLVVLGFDCEWDIFSAAETGAPHRRERWFCLGVSNTGRGSTRRIQYVTGTGGSSPDSGKSGQELANCGYHQQDECESRSQLAGGYTQRQSWVCGSELGNTDDAGLEGRRECGERPGERIAGQTDGELGITNGRQQQPGHEVDPIGQGGSARHEYSRTGRGVYPPARNDYDGWAGIDASAQPAFRRDADGLAVGMDPSFVAYRNDRLRAVGNGVVPLTVAVAWRELNRRMNERIDVSGGTA